jgi:imidazolonepropionase-like amidohydrolase
MKIKNYKSGIIRIMLLLIVFNSSFANDLVPGKKQDKPIALIHAKIFTVVSSIIDDGTIVFDKGKIIAVGDNNTEIPEKAEVIDMQGKYIYPGIIVAYSFIGLIEIEAVRATRDEKETGSFNPNARADVAYNPDSEVSPTIRSNGITTALIAPAGGVMSGMTSIISLDGWTIEDAEVKKNAGIILNWPTMTISSADRQKDGGKERQEKMDKDLQELETFIMEAQSYALAAKSDKNAIDIRFEAMRDVIDGKTPLIIQANEYKQIEAAVDFCNRHNLKMILLGGEDSWKLTSLLKRNNIPVLIKSMHRTPGREDEDYDLAFKRPSLLLQAGIKFAPVFISEWSWNNRNIPFMAGSAAAHGLSRENALKSITLWPAEIFGIDNILGSLQTGKNATLIVSKGDILDMQSNDVEMMFIEGRKVDLDNKHKRLYKKYSIRQERAAVGN